MNVRVWGTRGSVPAPRPSTQHYGGNTSCVEVRGGEPGTLVVLDAGTGICVLGATMAPELERVDILLSHLHMDHILGLGFFAGLFRPDLEVHIWGPGSTVMGLWPRLTRYLSPPLFPVRLRDLPCRLSVNDVPLGTFELPGMEVRSALVCHPGPTVGYRLDDGHSTLVYMSDHEPALGARHFPDLPRWTSGFDLAQGADVLIHDAQYSDDEYPHHIGWGHSSIGQAVTFATLAGVGHLVGFHHDPWRDDDALEEMYAPFANSALRVTPAHEGMVLAESRLLRDSAPRATATSTRRRH
jgi:ribonuclease BN (tRNA processing enzyme)